MALTDISSKEFTGAGEHTPTERVVERALAAVRLRTQREIEEIIGAAWHVLGENGWENLNVSQVLSHAHLSTSAFYRNFSGKSELLLTLFEQEVGRLAMQLRAAMAEVERPLDRVHVWISLHLQRGYGGSTQRRARRFALEGPVLAQEFPAEVAAIRRMIIDPLVEVIVEGEKCGDFPGANAEEDAIAIWLVMSSLLRDPHISGSSELTLDGVVSFGQGFCTRLLTKRFAD
jgi:AcrR family transcriptional regulator